MSRFLQIFLQETAFAASLLIFAFATCYPQCYPAMAQDLRVDGAEDPVTLVNPFIGTTNYGATHPGAVLPNGLMSITPFNVAGSSANRIDKDSTWWSTPYTDYNRYCIGFSQVNLSGVGCPDMGGLLLMPTTGSLQTDYRIYGDTLTLQQASPGYYSCQFGRSAIKAEVSATKRSSIARFVMPRGPGHIILNLGQGLTNESGAYLQFINDSTAIGFRQMGGFCYNSTVAFPLYFAVRTSYRPHTYGAYKHRQAMGVEAQWDTLAGRYQRYPMLQMPIAGDDLGAYFSFDCQEGQEILVSTAVSLCSADDALRNLEIEQPRTDFDSIHTAATQQWREALGRIQISGGSTDERTIFYTALYHSLIHPNVLADASLASELEPLQRYTVFSLWDTYRTVHPLLSLLYPRRQLDMVKSLLSFYQHNGFLPRWELYGQEAYTMEGDPALIVINDTYQRGLRDFDTSLAYEAMKKSATTPSKHNSIRPDIDDYLRLGYVPLRTPYDNSVSHSLEYYLADWNLARFAASLGYRDDAALFHRRSMGYKYYYCPDYGCLRPRLPDGRFFSPFDPRQGRNFAESPGFHEGSALNYSFFVPHDIWGLAKLMGGDKAFVRKLQAIFDEGDFDPTNEPDIAYPYLFTYFPSEAYRTSILTRRILRSHYHNRTDGLPGNDDAGTLSAWVVFTMLGFYPDCPGEPTYALTAPTFDRVRLKLDSRYYPSGEVVIEIERTAPADQAIFIREVLIDGRPLESRSRISHQSIVSAHHILFRLSSGH